MDIDLRTPNLNTETVTLSDGGTVTLRELPADELLPVMSAYQSLNGESTQSEKSGDLCLLMVSCCVIDAEGLPYLNNDEGREKLRTTQSWQRILEIAAHALRVNHMTEEQQEAKKKQ